MTMATKKKVPRENYHQDNRVWALVDHYRISFMNAHGIEWANARHRDYTVMADFIERYGLERARLVVDYLFEVRRGKDFDGTPFPISYFHRKWDGKIAALEAERLAVKKAEEERESRLNYFGSGDDDCET